MSDHDAQMRTDMRYRGEVLGSRCAIDERRLGTLDPRNSSPTMSWAVAHLRAAVDEVTAEVVMDFMDGFRFGYEGEISDLEWERAAAARALRKPFVDA